MMKEVEDDDFPLEDDQGYIQCNVPENTTSKNGHTTTSCSRASENRKSDTPAAREYLSPPAAASRSSVGYFSSLSADDSNNNCGFITEWTMGSRNRSKSCERLAIRSSSAVSLTQSLRSAGGGERTTPLPEVPPRPSEQLLNRHQQQRRVSNNRTPSSSSSSGRRISSTTSPPLHHTAPRTSKTRRKYVELELSGGGGTAGKGVGGKIATTNSRGTSSPSPKSAQRTTYSVIQIKDGEVSNTAPTAPTPTPRRGAIGRSRAPVQRRKSAGIESSLTAVVSTSTIPPPQPRYSATFTMHTSSSTSSSPSSSSSSSPQLLRHHSRVTISSPSSTPASSSSSSSSSSSKNRPYYSPRKKAISLDMNSQSQQYSQNTNAVISHEGLTLSLDDSEASSVLESSLHIINLRTGTTAFQDETGAPLQVHRPPPPGRRPPVRPPAPIPRPRNTPPMSSKPRASTRISEPDSLDPYVAMAPAAVPGAATVTPSRPRQTNNVTPLPRESWRQPTAAAPSSENKERHPTPPLPNGDMEEETEEIGAYSYVDVVRDRHLRVASDDRRNESGSLNPSSSSSSLPLATATTITNERDESTAFYMPLNTCQDEGGGVYMSPEPVEPPETPPPPDINGEAAPVLTNHLEDRPEPLYMAPGDTVYFHDQEMYAALDTTKLEDNTYAVRMVSPTPLTSTCS